MLSHADRYDNDVDEDLSPNYIPRTLNSTEVMLKLFQRGIISAPTSYWISAWTFNLDSLIPAVSTSVASIVTVDTAWSLTQGAIHLTGSDFHYRPRAPWYRFKDRLSYASSPFIAAGTGMALGLLAFSDPTADSSLWIKENSKMMGVVFAGGGVIVKEISEKFLGKKPFISNIPQYRNRELSSLQIGGSYASRMISTSMTIAGSVKCIEDFGWKSSSNSPILLGISATVLDEFFKACDEKLIKPLQKINEKKLDEVDERSRVRRGVGVVFSIACSTIPIFIEVISGDQVQNVSSEVDAGIRAAGVLAIKNMLKISGSRISSLLCSQGHFSQPKANPVVVQEEVHDDRFVIDPDLEELEMDMPYQLMTEAKPTPSR